MSEEIEGSGTAETPAADAGPEREAPRADVPARPAWLDRVAPAEGDGARGNGREARLLEPGSLGDDASDATDLAVERFREEAVRVARQDAESDVPSLEVEGRAHSEEELRDRARAFFERWKSRARNRTDTLIAEQEEEISERLGRASLLLDRFERITNDLVRLRARLSLRRQEVNESLGEEEGKKSRPRGLSTRIYLLAIGFLGVVEFFANAPVFSSLLPRDPLTERQIRLVTETSEGWLAGVERVVAHLILRPDAALLAAGVVTFLCVLAHFFGHSLRDLVIQKDRTSSTETVSSRSAAESVVPMVLSGLGLVLVLGVLYEARITLGNVGEERYQQDMVVVENLRNEAGWARVDGDLLESNDLENRAEDTETAAARLREYALSMSRLSFPILLLNLTLVLCAISAAYFHRRDRRREYFDESPFEEQRRALVSSAEETAERVSELLSTSVRHIRELRTMVAAQPLRRWRSVVHQLEAAISLYRTENGRLRGLDPRSVPAFTEPVKLDLALDPETAEGVRGMQDPDEYYREWKGLKARFEKARRAFHDEVVAG